MGHGKRAAVNSLIYYYSMFNTIPADRCLWDFLLSGKGIQHIRYREELWAMGEVHLLFMKEQNVLDM